jgi:hypothetical protein
LYQSGKLKVGEGYKPEGAGDHYSERYAGKVRSSHARKIPEYAKSIPKEAWEHFLMVCKEQGIKPTEALARQILGFKKTLGQPSKWARTQSQLKRDFVDGMDRAKFDNLAEFNKAKTRIDKMTPQQFEIMLHSIWSEEEDGELELGKYQQAVRANQSAGGGAAKEFDNELERILKTIQ